MTMTRVGCEPAKLGPLYEPFGDEPALSACQGSHLRGSSRCGGRLFGGYHILPEGPTATFEGATDLQPFSRLEVDAAIKHLKNRGLVGTIEAWVGPAASWFT